MGTRGHNLQEKKVAHRSRQMAAIILTGAGEMAGEDVVQRIRDGAEASVCCLRRRVMAAVVEAIDGKLRAPHIGRRQRVDSAEVLQRIAREGVAAEIQQEAI